MIGGGRDFSLGQNGALRFGPTASLRYTHLSIGAFQEQGAGGLDLNIHRQREEPLHRSLGARASYAICCGARRSLVPSVSAEWLHEFERDSRDIDAALASGDGSVFSVGTANLGHDSALIQGGLTMNWTENFATYLSYQDELGRENYESHSVFGGLRVRF